MKTASSNQGHLHCTEHAGFEKIVDDDIDTIVYENRAEITCLFLTLPSGSSMLFLFLLKLSPNLSFSLFLNNILIEPFYS